MRRKDSTLRNTLLDLARNIADTEGVDAINIRSIAQKADVATGTVYNYFSNKNEILVALTETYWEQTLLEMGTVIRSNSFCEQLEEIFSFLSARIDHPARMLMNSLGKLETAEQARMLSMQSVLEATLMQHMEQDADVRNDVWDESFTKEQFVHFIMMNMMMLLKEREPNLHFFIAMIKKTIY